MTTGSPPSMTATQELVVPKVNSDDFSHNQFPPKSIRFVFRIYDIFKSSTDWRQLPWRGGSPLSPMLVALLESRLATVLAPKASSSTAADRIVEVGVEGLALGVDFLDALLLLRASSSAVEDQLQRLFWKSGSAQAVCMARSKLSTTGSISVRALAFGHRRRFPLFPGWCACGSCRTPPSAGAVCRRGRRSASGGLPALPRSHRRGPLRLRGRGPQAVPFPERFPPGDGVLFDGLFFFILCHFSNQSFPSSSYSSVISWDTVSERNST